MLMDESSTIDPVGLEQVTVAVARFTLSSTDLLELPPIKGSFLRGVLGATLKHLTCARRNREDCPPCQLGNLCPYGYLFETSPPVGSQVMPKMSDIPLPFVLEPPLDTRMLYQPGDPVRFNLVLIGRGIQYLPFFLLVFEEAGRVGIGRRKARYVLETVEALHPLTQASQVIYRAGEVMTEGLDPQMISSDLKAYARHLPDDQVTVRFLTPTRIKHQERYVTEPDFHVLVRALLRRITALSYFHCDRYWQPDFHALITAASQVQTVAAAAQWQERKRYSVRQGQGTSLSGFVGDVIYQGNLASFRALLALGTIVHVGKATVFGNGKYAITPPVQDVT